MVNGHCFVRYQKQSYSSTESLNRSAHFLNWIKERRSIRDFSERPVEKEVIDNIIMTASSAPSGANKQPWTFCVVTNPEIKKKIREAAEKEEYDNYHGRMSKEWLNDLAPFQTVGPNPSSKQRRI